MTDLAWAGGFFDAEGSTVVLAQGRWLRLRVQLPQKGGSEDGGVLKRFAAVIGTGRVAAPDAKGVSMFYTSKSCDAVEALQRLVPWIGTVKRGQAMTASRRMLDYLDSTPKAIGPRSILRRHTRDGLEDLLMRQVGSPSWSHDETLAWAAGLLDGDGWFCCPRSWTNPSRVLTAGIGQSGEAGVPEVLRRFREIVGCGRISGPLRRRNTRAMPVGRHAFDPPARQGIDPAAARVGRAQSFFVVPSFARSGRRCGR